MGTRPWHCIGYRLRGDIVPVFQAHIEIRKPMSTLVRSILTNQTSFRQHLFTSVLQKKALLQLRRRIHVSSASNVKRSIISLRIARIISAESTREKLLHCTEESSHRASDKISVVGVGQVGVAAVAALLMQGVTKHVAMVDITEKRLTGEALDFLHAAHYMGNPKIEYSTGFAVTAHSKVCIIAAGHQHKTGETRLDLAQRNSDVIKKIVPELVKHSPETVLLISSNPVDVLTYVTWKISGLQKHRVIGTGTNIDTGRFRMLIGEKLGIAPSSCHGYVIGEHGDSSVAVWSGVNIAGVRLCDLNKQIGSDEDPERWKEVHTTVVKSGFHVVDLKGYTSWAIGLCLSHICQSVLSDTGDIQAVSTYVKGVHGIKEEVFLSLPCVLGSGGVYHVVHQPLDKKETELLHKSAKAVHAAQATVKL